MKNDFIKEKIRLEWVGMVKFTLIFVPIVFALCAALFLWIAATYDKVEPVARVLMYILSAISGLAAIAYPSGAMYSIKTYPKHKRLAYLFLQKYVFKHFK